MIEAGLIVLPGQIQVAQRLVNLDIIRVVLSGSLTQQADVDARAAALLGRAKFEQLAGRMVAPHNGIVELYDKLAIFDTRGTV